MEPPKPAETVEPQPPAKNVESAKAKICAKNNLSNLDMIPLGMNKAAQPTKWRVLPKNFIKLVIFMIGLAFTWV